MCVCVCCVIVHITHTIHTHTDEHLPTEPHNMQCAVCLEEGQMAEYALFACCHVFCPHCTNQLAVRCLACPVCRCPNGGVSNQQQEQHDVGAFLSNAIDAVHVSSESPQAMGDYDQELDDVLGHAFAIASSMTSHTPLATPSPVAADWSQPRHRRRVLRRPRRLESRSLTATCWRLRTRSFAPSTPFRLRSSQHGCGL